MPILHNDNGLPIIQCLEDIREIIKDFLPSNKSTGSKISTTMNVEGKNYNVSASLDGDNPGDQLREGFDIIKRRLVVLEKTEGKTLSPVVVDGRMWLDDLIRIRLGGSRDGLRVKWVISSGTYFFDPYTGKLFKKDDVSDDS